MIQETVLLVVLITLIVNGIIALLNKLNAFEWLQGHARWKFTESLYSCLFCMSHHIATIVLIPFCIYDFEWMYFLIPLCVAGITNKIN